MKRKGRGRDLTPEVTDDHVVLAYQGLDGVVRRTLLQFEPRPARITASTARLDLALRPEQEATFFLTVGYERVPTAPVLLRFEDARAEAQVDLERYSAWSCHVRMARLTPGSIGRCLTCT